MEFTIDFHPFNLSVRIDSQNNSRSEEPPNLFCRALYRSNSSRGKVYKRPHTFSILTKLSFDSRSVVPLFLLIG